MLLPQMWDDLLKLDKFAYEFTNGDQKQMIISLVIIIESLNRRMVICNGLWHTGRIVVGKNGVSWAGGGQERKDMGSHK